MTAFVCPTTGETRWYLTDTLSKPLSAAIAKAVGAGSDRCVVLLPFTPRLPPPEAPWTLVAGSVVDAFLANQDKLIDITGSCSDRTARRGEIGSRVDCALSPASHMSR